MTTLTRTAHLVHGTFISELNNRFLCLVNIGGSDVICYIPSSCKLSNFIDLSGKEVLLAPVSKKNSRTEYSVYAVKYERSYILLNLLQANRIVAEQIHNRRFSFLGKRNTILREARFDGYNADLFIKDTQTIIEVKSLLSFQASAQFPTIYSERAIHQLEQLAVLLDKGYKVCYLFISLNPNIKQVTLNDSIKQYRDLFLECIRKGMQCRAYSVRFKDSVPCLNKTLPVNLFTPF